VFQRLWAEAGKTHIGAFLDEVSSYLQKGFGDEVDVKYTDIAM
jgi:hypothetical protein